MLMSTPATRTRPRRRLWVAAVLGVATLAGLAGVTGEFGPSARAVAAADLVLISGAALCEVVSYLLLGSLVRRLAGDATLTRATAIRIGLIAIGLGSVLPASPVTGVVIAARELEANGVAPRRTFATVGLAQWYALRALIALAVPAAVALGILAAVHSRGLHAGVLLGAAVVFGAVFVASGFVASRPGVLERIAARLCKFPLLRSRSERMIAWWTTFVGEIRTAMGERSNRIRLLAIAISATAADAACFALAFQATGVHVAPRAVAIAYALTIVAMFVPVLPSGIGVGEAAVATYLHAAHSPIAPVLAGMVVYRALATLMPAVAGAGVLAELRARRLLRRVRPRTSA